jgi:hypothetical protein
MQPASLPRKQSYKLTSKRRRAPTANWRMVASLIASVDNKHGSPRQSHDEDGSDERERYYPPKGGSNDKTIPNQTVLPDPQNE